MVVALCYYTTPKLRIRRPTAYTWFAQLRPCNIHYTYSYDIIVSYTSFWFPQRSDYPLQASLAKYLLKYPHKWPINNNNNNVDEAVAAPLTLQLVAVAPFHPPAVAEEVIAVASEAAEEVVGVVTFVEVEEVVISVAAEAAAIFAEAEEAVTSAEAEEVVISVEAEAEAAAAVVPKSMKRRKYTR